MPPRTLILLAGLLLAIVPSLRAQPVRVQELIRTNSAGSPLRGWFVTVDLTDPNVEIVVTDPLPPGTNYDAVLQRTTDWQAANAVNLAINANFFATLSATTADIVGLSMSDAVVASPVRTFNGAPDPAIVFRSDRTASIANIAATDLAGVVDAVAGVGPSTSDADPGSLLVTNGLNTGATARVDPANRNPRTGVGLNQDGTRLTIIVVDGRQPSWSVGVTLPEFADLFIERGCWRALNLDGGDSTSFVFQPPGSTSRTLNRPSGAGNTFRAVANHLGIRYTNPAPALPPREIRGAWLRPPTPSYNSATLEINLANMARAGFTDLYLETFFWGVATNNSNIFPDRYPNFDALADAIRLAAKYNLRVHAWCESGYWQFGSTGADNFTNNPDWRSISRATGQPGGDGTAGQVFANLTNPGVQQKLRSYFAELANYPGLWGIQTDYHRFALDDNTSDAFPAPWSYDAWTIATFQSLYGADPTSAADTTADALWGRFLSWRRAGISEAANQMLLGINAVNPSIDFSIAMFATAMTSTAQLTKCQDWPAMAANNFVETLVPMAYGSSTSSINSDVLTALQLAAGKRVIPGLAISGTATHPPVADQLNTIRARGLESFIFFDATWFNTPARQNELKDWLLNTATRAPADFNADSYVSAADLALFNAIYTGTPVPVNPSNALFNLDPNAFIDANDLARWTSFFVRATFGEDAVVDHRDLAALQACFAQTPALSSVPHLYDLNADGVVNYPDQIILHSYLTVPIADDTDVNRDGRLNIEDLYRQHQSPIDVIRDGVLNAADRERLIHTLRSTEVPQLLDSRP